MAALVTSSAAVKAEEKGFGLEPNPGLKAKDITQVKVTEIVKAKFNALVVDYETRKEAAKKDYTIIQKRGFWFGNDVYQLLQDQEPVDKNGKKPTLELFRAMGSFFHGKAPTGFTIQSAPKDMKFVTGKHVQRYVLNPQSGLTAEQGLFNAKETFSFTDCGSLIQIAYYETLLEIWGSERFNQYFKADGEHPLILDPHPQSTPLMPFIDERLIQLEGTFGRRKLLEGDWVNVANVPSYGFVHKMGEWQGENAIYWGLRRDLDGPPLATPKSGNDQIFKGFGFTSNGVTEYQVIKRLVEAHNDKPLEIAALVTEEVAKLIMDSYEPFIEVEARKAGQTREELKESYANLQISEDSFYQVMELCPGRAGLREAVKRLSAEKILTQMEGPKKEKPKKQKGKRK